MGKAAGRGVPKSRSIFRYSDVCLGHQWGLLEKNPAKLLGRVRSTQRMVQPKLEFVCRM